MKPHFKQYKYMHTGVESKLSIQGRSQIDVSQNCRTNASQQFHSIKYQRNKKQIGLQNMKLLNVK